jgi:PAS domain S-box-containing protein
MSGFKSLGEVIRERRQQLGLSQEQLAERISSDSDFVTQADISRLETGRVKLPRYERLIRLAEAVEMLPGDMLARSGWASVAADPFEGPGGLFDRISDGLYVVDLAWRCLYVNRRGAELVNRSPDELIGANVWDIFPEAADLPIHADAHQALRDNVPAHFEAFVPLLRKWITADLYPGPEGLTILAHDTTDRRQLETLWSGLLDAAPDAIVTVNEDGRIIQVNTRAEEMFGYQRDELIDKPVELLLPEQAREIHQIHRGGYVADPHTRPMGAGMELYGRRKDGSEIPIEVSLSPLLTANEILVIGAIRDVTAQKKIEEQVRTSQERLELALEHSSIILASLDRDLRYTWIFNPHDDFSVKQAIGKRDDELLPPDVAGPFMAFKREVLESGIGRRRLCAFPLSDGDRVYDVLAKPIRDVTGHILGIRTASVDVTESRLAETALLDLLVDERMAQIGMEHAAHPVDDKLAVINQRLLGPLANIIGSTHLIRHSTARGAVPSIDTLLQRLDEIENAALKITDVFDDLPHGQLSKTDPALELQTTAADLVRLVTAAVRSVNDPLERQAVQIDAHVSHLFGAWNPVLIGAAIRKLVSWVATDSPFGDSVVVTIRAETTQTEQWAVVEMRKRDSGSTTVECWNPDDTAARRFRPTDVFDTDVPFLSLVRHVISQHGGLLTLDTSHERTPYVVLRLPLPPEHAADTLLDDQDISGVGDPTIDTRIHQA